MHRTNEELRREIRETCEQMNICTKVDTWQALARKLQTLVDRLAWQLKSEKTF